MPTAYQIQNSQYKNILPENITSNSVSLDRFDNQLNLKEIFNELPVEIEAHSSFIKKKFRDNLYKVSSFE